MTANRNPVRKHLDAALFECAAAIEPIAHDMETDQFGYVSAERMLQVVREQMIKRGLMLRRQTGITIVHRGNLITSGVLASTWTLTHVASGEKRIEVTEWPFESRPEWPLEQAVAAALTTSLAYYLRDLGMVVRGVPGSTAPPMADDLNTRGARPRERSISADGGLSELAAWLNGILERANVLGIDRDRIIDASREKIRPNAWGDAGTWTPEVRAWLEKYIQGHEEQARRRADPNHRQDVQIAGRPVLRPHPYEATENVNEPGYWQGKLLGMARSWMQTHFPDQPDRSVQLLAAAERAFGIPAPDTAKAPIATCLAYRDAIVELESHPEGWDALLAQVS